MNFDANTGALLGRLGAPGGSTHAGHAGPSTPFPVVPHDRLEVVLRAGLWAVAGLIPVIYALSSWDQVGVLVLVGGLGLLGFAAWVLVRDLVRAPDRDPNVMAFRKEVDRGVMLALGVVSMPMLCGGVMLLGSIYSPNPLALLGVLFGGLLLQMNAKGHVFLDLRRRVLIHHHFFWTERHPFERLRLRMIHTMVRGQYSYDTFGTGFVVGGKAIPIDEPLGEKVPGARATIENRIGYLAWITGVPVGAA
jgi:hypothetical protein